MTRLACVAPGDVAHLWPMIAPHARRAAEKAGNGGFEDLERDLLDGHSLLWLVIQDSSIVAYAVTDLLWDGVKKVCVVLSCAGHGRAGWLHHLRSIEAWAAGEHCEAVRIYGRKGWRRVLRDYRPIDGGLEKALR